MIKPVALVALAVLGLSACSAEGDLDGNLDVGGMDPASWTVEVNHQQGKSLISILGEPSFEGALPVKSKGEGGAIVLTSKTDQGDFAMTMTHKDCFDGLAEAARPWTVTVAWKGEILNGCATPKSQASG